MYLGLHYPSSLDRISAHEHAPNRDALAFPQRVAQLLIKLAAPNYTSALDVGCAVGGTSFELAKVFQHVDALIIVKHLLQLPNGSKKDAVSSFQCA